MTPPSPARSGSRARRPSNPGGPLTDQDHADARSLLGPLIGFGPGPLAPDRLHDHTDANYDPNRIVRVLTALRDALPAEIDTWRRDRISRADAEKLWKGFLQGECAGCAEPCHNCGEWARAVRYERAEARGRLVWRPRRTDDQSGRRERRPRTGP